MPLLGSWTGGGLAGAGVVGSGGHLGGNDESILSQAA